MKKGIVFALVLYVICENMTNLTPQNPIVKRFNVGERYRLTLRIDGDYMDILPPAEVDLSRTYDYLITANDYTENVFIQNTNDPTGKTSLPIWLLLAVIGVVVIAGGVVLVVVKRKW